MAGMAPLRVAVSVTELPGEGETMIVQQTFPTSDATTSAAMAELARHERQVEERWRSLALAEQRGQTPRALERMYAAYVRAVDAYVMRQRALARQSRATRRLAS